MKMYDGMTFVAKIGPFKMCDLNLEMYVNNDYECACGERHTFDYDSEILCQGAFKLILECPNHKEFVTCVKLKSKFLGFGFAGFESLFGTKLIPNDAYNLSNYDESVFDESNPNNLPDDLKNSSFMFNYIIKKHIGLI